MKKYKGICSFYRGFIAGKMIEAETEAQLLKLASRIANAKSEKQHILYREYVVVADDMSESTPLPQEYFVRLQGYSWKYKGEVPKDLRVNISA